MPRRCWRLALQSVTNDYTKFCELVSVGGLARMDDDDDDVMEGDPEDDWVREHQVEKGFCPICGEDGCRSAH